jgi:hypothetical protein
LGRPVWHFLTGLLEDLIGYLNTWSAVKLFREANQRDPMVDLKSRLEEAWKDPGPKEFRWKIILRAGKKG